MLKFSFKPTVADYTNPHHLTVNLSFDEVSGDEPIGFYVEKFKEFLCVMSFSKELVDRIYYDDGKNVDDDDILWDDDSAYADYVPPTEEECEEIAQYAVVEDLVQAHETIYKDYEKKMDMDEVEEIVAVNEEHRS